MAWESAGTVELVVKIGVLLLHNQAYFPSGKELLLDAR
jgi:hypothetical protein